MKLPLKDLESFTQQEMSRKEFLRLVGAAMLGIIGVTGLIQNIHKIIEAPQSKSNSTLSGYGASPYGK